MGRPIEKIPAFDMQSMACPRDFDQLCVWKVSRKIGCIGRRHQDVFGTGNDERRRSDVAQGVGAVEQRDSPQLGIKRITRLDRRQKLHSVLVFYRF
jgi:hypothetical protein